MEKREHSIIWMVAHFPDHIESGERVEKTVEVYRSNPKPIWIFASLIAQYEDAIEDQLKR